MGYSPKLCGQRRATGLRPAGIAKTHMKIDQMRERAEELLAKEAAIEGGASDAEIVELHQGTVSVLRRLHGPESPQEVALETTLAKIRKHTTLPLPHYRGALRGALNNVIAEIDAGFLGSLQGAVTGEVLTDLIKLSRESLAESGESAKNVAAVLAAAAFEDTIRRLGNLTNIAEPGRKLADELTALKDKGVLTGAQVGIAQSYLKFRNDALHARWDAVQSEGVESILGFTEQLIIKHFV